MDVPHRAMASPVGRRLSSFASARASSSSARRTRSADPGFPFWLAPSRRLFVARDDETMLSPRRSSPSRHDSAEPKLLVWGSAARAEPNCWRSDTAVSLLSVALASSSEGVYRRRRLHVSYLAYVIAGRLDFLDIWPLYPPLGHGTVHHSSGCTNWSQISLDILLNERANDGGTASKTGSGAVWEGGRGA